MTRRPEDCDHNPLKISVHSTQMTDIPNLFMAEVRVECSKCGIHFVFKGVKAGLSFEHPMATVDGQGLIAPMHPKDSRIFPAVSGFEVKAS